ncbi:hypothetical protein CsSME_00001430 [Camellia sinensis var. sinensis]
MKKIDREEGEDGNGRRRVLATSVRVDRVVEEDENILDIFENGCGMWSNAAQVSSHEIRHASDAGYVACLQGKENAAVEKHLPAVIEIIGSYARSGGNLLHGGTRSSGEEGPTLLGLLSLDQFALHDRNVGALSLLRRGQFGLVFKQMRG